MIIGIGIDLVEIKDFQKNLYANKKILHRIFTTEECKLNCISLAGVFAAKESLIKAIGTINNFNWKDAQVCHDVYGKPLFVLNNDLDKELKKYNILLSITHTKSYAQAITILQLGSK
jgi:phosphopantetheine--protein transferase-like protein